MVSRGERTGYMVSRGERTGYMVSRGERACCVGNVIIGRESAGDGNTQIMRTASDSLGMYMCLHKFQQPDSKY